MPTAPPSPTPAPNPSPGQGHGHEDGLDAAAGLQAERGAAVVHQVELDIPLVIEGGWGEGVTRLRKSRSQSHHGRNARRRPGPCSTACRQQRCCPRAAFQQLRRLRSAVFRHHPPFAGAARPWPGHGPRHCAVCIAHLPRRTCCQAFSSSVNSSFMCLVTRGQYALTYRSMAEGEIRVSNCAATPERGAPVLRSAPAG
jgi:hypothetical protein